MSCVAEFLKAVSISSGNGIFCSLAFTLRAAIVFKVWMVSSYSLFAVEKIEHYEPTVANSGETGSTLTQLRGILGRHSVKFHENFFCRNAPRTCIVRRLRLHRPNARPYCPFQFAREMADPLCQG